jgi:carboxylesterase type B
VVDLPSGAGARLYRPTAAAAPTAALLWIHGGGYLLGSPEQDDALCRRYVQRLGIVVAAARYRLAPEHPYPIPLEDCYQVLTWLAGLPGVDADRIAIGGASAGGPAFWPLASAPSVKVLGLWHRLLNKRGDRAVELHPAEITLIRSRSQVEEIIRSAGWRLVSYSVSPSDLFIQAVVVCE